MSPATMPTKLNAIGRHREVLDNICVTLDFQILNQKPIRSLNTESPVFIAVDEEMNVSET